MEWLHDAYAKRKDEITGRLEEFSRVKDDDVFYELCFCLLTPQSNGMRCDEAVTLLREKNFIENTVHLIPILKTKTRFHHHKARYLQLMKKIYPEIANMLSTERDAHRLREWCGKRERHWNERGKPFFKKHWLSWLGDT